MKGKVEGGDSESSLYFHNSGFCGDMAPWCFVSPASRGIGFALTRQILKETNAPVVATVRRGNILEIRDSMLKGLNGIDDKRLTVLKMDFIGTMTTSAPPTASKER